VKLYYYFKHTKNKCRLYYTFMCLGYFLNISSQKIRSKVNLLNFRIYHLSHLFRNFIIIIDCVSLFGSFQYEGGNEDSDTAVGASHFFRTENCINLHIKTYKGYVTVDFSKISYNLLLKTA